MCVYIFKLLLPGQYVPWTLGCFCSVVCLQWQEQLLILWIHVLKYKSIIIHMGFPGKECQCRRLRFNPWVVLWRWKWQPALVFLPEKSHGQRSLAEYSSWCHKRVKLYYATEQQQLFLLMFPFNLEVMWILQNNISNSQHWVLFKVFYMFNQYNLLSGALHCITIIPSL